MISVPRPAILVAFRLYTKLSGMTGTALTEEEEFGAIYKLDIVEIPTHKPMI